MYAIRSYYALTAGESCSYSENTGEIEKKSNTGKNYLSWKTRNIKFDNTNIVEVCKILSHDFNTGVECRGDNLDDIAITTGFNNESLENIIEIISLTINARNNFV